MIKKVIFLSIHNHSNYNGIIRDVCIYTLTLLSYQAITYVIFFFAKFFY